MSIQVQVPVSTLLFSGLTSISEAPVSADPSRSTQNLGSQDVFIPAGQGPDMRPASLHLNQFWSLMGQPVDMATDGQSPDMAVQPPDMIAGQPIDM